MVHDFDEVVDRHGTDSKKYSTNHFPADVIPMWIADSDFKAPQPILDALQERLNHGILGYPEKSQRLKEAAAYWMKSRFHYEVGPECVEYTPGVIAGVDYSIQGLSQPGDGVILQFPAYPPFVQAITSNDRELIANELVLRDGRYEIDFELFEKACRRPNAKLFILCSPQNPTGRVFTREELVRMGEICMENGVTIISDEIHSDLVYPKYRHTTFAGISKEFAQNCVTLINPSKTFNIPGMRTAALIAEDQEKKEKVYQQMVKTKAFGETVFGVVAFCAAYEKCAYYADQEVAYMEGNLDAAREMLAPLKTIDLIEPEGTYLLWLDCRKAGLSQEALVKRFVEEAKVGIQSGTNFGINGAGFVRLNAAVPRSVLVQALQRIVDHFA